MSAITMVPGLNGATKSVRRLRSQYKAVYRPLAGICDARL
jgi:hypothetical protein